MVDRLVPYLRGGKTRNDLVGLQGSFSEALANLIEGAPPEVRKYLGIGSAFRSPERQQQLYTQAVAKYGSESAARKWVAPPGKSRHNHGQAVDLGFGAKGTPEYEMARKYAHENAQKYGLVFPMGHEPWHVEPAGARGGKTMTLPASAGGPASGPSAPGGSAVPSMVGQPAPMEMTAPAAVEEPNIASILGNAMTAYSNSQAQMPQQQPQMQQQLAPQPNMMQKKPDLAKILATQTNPLLIGRPAA